MPLRTSRGMVSAVAAVLVLAASVGIAAAATADEPDGIGLTVTVTSTPTPSPTPSQPGAGSGNSGSGTVVTPIDEPTDSATPRPGEEDLGGILYISGLSFEGRSSVNPAATQANLQFTVHNVSDAVITAKATFRVDNAFGVQLGKTLSVRIYQLKPDETRVVQGTIHDLGQWGVLHGTAVLTPPKEVDGVALKPFIREQYFFVVPWFASGLAVLAGAALIILWILRYSAAAAAGAVLSPRVAT